MARRAPLGRDDAWIIFTSGSTGTPKGVAVTPSQRRGVRRRRGATVPAATTRSGPGDRRAGRTVGRVRRVVRGDVAGVAARRLPGARAALARAQRRGPRAVAGDAATSPSCRRCRRWPALWPAEALDGGAAADLRRRGVPAGAGRAAGRRGPRGVEHLRPDRGDRGRVRGPADRRRAGAHRAAAGRAGIWPWSTRTAYRSGRSARSANSSSAAWVWPATWIRTRTPKSTRRCRRWAGTRAYRSGDLVRAGTRRPGASSAAPTTRSRSAAAASSSARWTPPCVTLPGVSGGAAGGATDAPAALPRWSAMSRAPTSTLDIANGPRHAGRDAARRAGADGWCSSTSCPTRTSGKVDRDALPWPTAGGTPGADGAEEPDLGGTMGWLAGLWRGRARRAGRRGPEADFHALGGGSLSAAQLGGGHAPTLSAGDRRRPLRPSPARSLAGYLDEPRPAAGGRNPRRQAHAAADAQAVQVALSLPLATLTGLQWGACLASRCSTTLSPQPDPMPCGWCRSTGGGSPPASCCSSASAGPHVDRGVRARGFLLWRPGTRAPTAGAARCTCGVRALPSGLGEGPAARRTPAGARWLVLLRPGAGQQGGQGRRLRTPPAPRRNHRDAGGWAPLLHRASRSDLSGHRIDGDHFHVGPHHRRQRRHHRRRAPHCVAARGCRGARTCRRRARLWRGRQR